MTESAPAKRTTVTETVMRLFVRLSLSRITTIGTTKETPPANATMKRASLSTNGLTSSGGLFDRYSSVLRRCSCFVYVTPRGSRALSQLRSGSAGRKDLLGRRKYKELKGSP